MTHFNVTSTYGAVGAAMNFALIMLLYLVNMNLLAEWYVGILALLIIVVFLFLGTVAARKANEGVFSFGQAWMASMTVAAVAQILGAALTCPLPSHRPRIAWGPRADHVGQVAGNDGGIWHEWRHA